MNHFDTKDAALRYQKGRPYFHPLTIEKIRGRLSIHNKVDNALDVACGTGLSTRAMLSIAENVYGTDLSGEMIANAYPDDRIQYRLANATLQPFEDDFFDILTVSSGLHWFELDAFLKEASRIMKPGAWLVVYDNFFLSEMAEVLEFNNWFTEVYCKGFPPPKRKPEQNLLNENLADYKLSFEGEESFKNEVFFSLDELILYLTTQSNISAAVATGKTYEEIESWLQASLKPFFKEEKRTLCFGNWIKYIQKIK